MYTVVLMMAMTGGSETTTFGGRRCNGCNGGCNGAVASGCHGGCNGRGHGCNGGGRMFGRHGCNGGGCHGGGCHGGCSGASACHGGCHGGVATVQPRRSGEFAEEQSETGPTPNRAAPNGMVPATIIVELPAEARLTVDGEATTSTSGRRVFRSPPLAQGSEYFYTINAEIMRNGQPVTVTRRVPVTAGRETRITVDFDRDGNTRPRQVRPAAGEADPQPSRDLPNLERPKNNDRNPQPNP
jgi:uncharacterized protein (TIGR03000 family)